MEHLAMIADGNRRWAKEHGRTQWDGHAAGLRAIENACLWAIRNDVPYLTVYCFSTENWNRSAKEVDSIMHLARVYFGYRVKWFVQHDIAVQFIGRIDRLPIDILDMMDDVEDSTAQGISLTLTICVDYGGRDEIARAVIHGAATEEDITKALTEYAPEPDVILRTGGRHRLSNFMLWQGAYSEIYFSDTLFPALNDAELDEVKEWFEAQVRNFGA